jgi:hypothetical protein
MRHIHLLMGLIILIWRFHSSLEFLSRILRYYGCLQRWNVCCLAQRLVVFWWLVAWARHLWMMRSLYGSFLLRGLIVLFLKLLWCKCLKVLLSHALIKWWSPILYLILWLVLCQWERAGSLVSRYQLGWWCLIKALWLAVIMSLGCIFFLYLLFLLLLLLHFMTSKLLVWRNIFPILSLWRLLIIRWHLLLTIASLRIVFLTLLLSMVVLNYSWLLHLYHGIINIFKFFCINWFYIGNLLRFRHMMIVFRCLLKLIVNLSSLRILINLIINHIL